MTRVVTVAAAQLGPIARDELRARRRRSIAPTGEMVACDLDRCREIQDNIFNFALHREPESYGLITQTKGARPEHEGKP